MASDSVVDILYYSWQYIAYVSLDIDKTPTMQWISNDNTDFLRFCDTLSPESNMDLTNNSTPGLYVPWIVGRGLQ